MALEFRRTGVERMEYAMNREILRQSAGMNGGNGVHTRKRCSGSRMLGTQDHGMMINPERAFKRS